MQYITQGVLADGTPDATRQRLLARTPPSTSRIVKEPICPPPAGVGTSFQLPKKPEGSEAPLRSLVPSSSPGAGGADRDRTGDPLLAKQVLSQLSYSPGDPGPGPAQSRLVGLDGFEPSTPALSRRCSNQLSYRPGRGALKPSLRGETGTADRGWALRGPERRSL